MNLELATGKYEQKNLTPIAGTQLKVQSKIELQSACKKILGITSTVHVGIPERVEADVKLSGKVVTRVIYIDENDGFNSEERGTDWSEKLSLPNADEVASITPSVHIVETHPDTHGKNDSDLIIEVNSTSIVNVGIIAVIQKEVNYVKKIHGNVESMTKKQNMSTFGLAFCEKFELIESFVLDSNVDGILGVDATAAIRDINCNDGRIIIKGIASANATTVKTGEYQIISNHNYDWDFTKSINNKAIGIDDSIFGSVTVSNSSIKIESRDKAELVITLELLFTGHSIVSQEVEYVEDAFEYDHTLDFSYSNVENSHTTGQATLTADIEGNVMMPDGSPYIGKVLTVSGVKISGVNVVPSDGRATIEGILSCVMVYECEEKTINSHIAQVPFSTVVKSEGINTGHNIVVSITTTACNIKARRGKELLVDARIVVNLYAYSTSTQKVTTDLVLGKEKEKCSSAILVHVVGENENLWDIAKNMNLPIAKIVAQNPAAQNEIKSGDRILVYRQAE